MKRLFSIGIIVVAMMLFTCANAFAHTDISGYEFVKNTYITDTDIEDSVRCRNPKDYADSHTESCTRTKTWGGSIGGSGETSVKIAAIKAKVTVNAEVNYSTSTETTSSHTCPTSPYSTYICEWGSDTVRLTGTMNKWFNSKITASYGVNTSWTKRAYYGGYYD